MSCIHPGTQYDPSDLQPHFHTKAYQVNNNNITLNYTQRILLLTITKREKRKNNFSTTTRIKIHPEVVNLETGSVHYHIHKEEESRSLLVLQC